VLARGQPTAYISSTMAEGFFEALPLPKPRAFTVNEAATAARVPLKQVHRIIDAGLLEGLVETRGGTRLIGGTGLLALKLAHVTADVLRSDARRRAVLRLLAEPGEFVIRDGAVRVEVTGIEADLQEGLAELAAARAMIATDPGAMGGTPCFAGTRIPVHDIADMLANGDAPAALLEAYPALDERRVRLAAVYAAAYPRRGRPKRAPAWRASPPKASRRIRLDDLPPAA
jgi:uncharacterized protein (DUF433 family)